MEYKDVYDALVQSKSVELEEDIMEALLDVQVIGAEGILFLLADVCRKKADHLRADWQDEEAAECWDEAAHKIEVCGRSLL